MVQLPVVGSAVLLCITAAAARRARLEELARRTRRRIGTATVEEGAATVEEVALAAPLFAVGRRAVAALARARPPGGPARCWVVWRAVVPLAAVAGTFAAGPGGGLLMAVASVAGPAVALHLARGRADAVYERCVPLVLEDTARQLRAGRALGESLVRAGASGASWEEPRLARDLEQLGHALDSGETLAGGIVAWARARPLPCVQLAAAALGVAAAQGGGQARAVEGVAATLRQRLDRAAEMRAATAQSRASVAVLGLAPLAFALVATVLDPRTARSAVSSPAGLLSISAGLALDLLAVVWMHRLTQAV
jgi:tight adherence protein B